MKHFHEKRFTIASTIQESDLEADLLEYIRVIFHMVFRKRINKK